MSQVKEYVSDEDESLTAATNTIQESQKKRGCQKNWVKVATFDNAKEAENSLEKIWSKYYTNKTDEGRRVYFRCNKAKRRGPQCSAKMQLYYHADNDKVTALKTEEDHDHDQNDSTRGIDSDTKAIIQELYNDGIMKPKQILRALESKTIKVPTNVQLKNFLIQLKKKKYGENKISLGELEQWCINNSIVPIDDDEPFVVSHNITYEDDELEDDEDVEDDNENKFHVFISTKRLLSIAHQSTHLHADATYKLVWQGFPVLIVGTTDLNKCFHPFGLAICTNEKTKDFEFIFSGIQIGFEKLQLDTFKPKALVSDAADAIKAAFINVFGDDVKCVMCWAHMKRKIESRICHIDDKETQKEIMEDIEMLQLSSSKDIFDTATSLFFKKWTKMQKNQSVLDFMSYFEKEWIDSNNGWYEGVEFYVPSTNNALEATNKVVKDDGTYRERHVLSRFLVIASDIVKNWSAERKSNLPNAKKFAKQPDISLQLWTSAYQWAKLQKDITCVENETTKLYYIPARDIASIQKADLNRYINSKWTNFNQFKKSHDIWCMQMIEGNDWIKSKCNCPFFLKNYICKHIVGLALRLKLCKVPAAAKTVPIGEKRKRGRPAKAKRALLTQ